MFSVANNVIWLCALFEARALAYLLPRQPLLAVCVSVRTLLLLWQLCVPECMFSVRYAPLVQEPYCS